MVGVVGILLRYLPCEGISIRFNVIESHVTDVRSLDRYFTQVVDLQK